MINFLSNEVGEQVKQPPEKEICSAIRLFLLTKKQPYKAQKKKARFFESSSPDKEICFGVEGSTYKSSLWKIVHGTLNFINLSEEQKNQRKNVETERKMYMTYVSFVLTKMKNQGKVIHNKPIWGLTKKGLEYVEEDYKPTTDVEELNTKTKTIPKKEVTNIPKGQRKPKQKQVTQTVCERDPEIKKWVLENANGICEKCDKPGPFKDKNGNLFLVVHHVTWLANGGADTTTNGIAVCPNCHSECHYGEDIEAIAQELRNKIARLSLDGS